MQNKTVQSASAPAPIGPYSQAILSGNTLYCSGQIALDASSGKMIQESIRHETEQVMKNLGEVLDEAGMTFDQVVKTTIFLSDLGDFSEMNSAYGSYFKTHYPARETVQVSALPKGARVEISMIAVR
jgi:2-iminobutanoate/2-iminopropanoate deaminase